METSRSIGNVTGTNPEYMDSVFMVRENFMHMVKKNETEVEAAENNKLLCRQCKWAEIVFQTCQTLGINNQCVFHTLEIFNAFVVRDLEESREFVFNCESTDKDAHWITVVKEMEEHLYLRLISCIQLVCKFLSLSGAVTVCKLQEKLEELECYYPEESILMSEQRVLKTLGNGVQMQSPYDFIQIILDMLGRMFYQIKDLQADIESFSADLLTLLFLRYDHISLRVLKKSARLSSVDNAEARFQADKLLAAMAVVDAALQVHAPAHYDLVKDGLHSLTQIPQEDVACVKEAVLMEAIMFMDPLQRQFTHAPMHLVNQASLHQAAQQVADQAAQEAAQLADQLVSQEAAQEAAVEAAVQAAAQEAMQRVAQFAARQVAEVAQFFSN